jgi:hypothetical protein
MSLNIKAINNENIHHLLTKVKKFFVFLGLIISCFHVNAQVVFGVNNYTQYHIGSLPIIISVPHGGLVAPDSIPNRTCNSPTFDLDSRTIELARQIDTALYNLTGCRPHLIICNLRRTKVDCNRNITDGACGNLNAENAWIDFHNFIDSAQLIAQTQYGDKALYIDLHGHGKKPYRLELGYGLSATAFNNSDSVLNTKSYIESSSIENLVKTNISGSTHAQLLRGPNSLGTLFANAGFPAIPSQQTPDTGGFPYFNGGYNTFNYTCLASGNSVNGLQIECDSTVRFGYLNRKKFADSTASVIVNYLNIHQNLNLLLDCGLTTTVKESENIIANSIKIFPNPARDVLQLAINDIHENYKTIIFSTVGEVVLEASNQNKLNVSKLAGGLYFVNVVLDNRTIWRSKIIIEK